MSTEHIIAAEAFSAHHQIDLTFIQALHEQGLVEIILIEQRPYLSVDQLPGLERMIRLHYDLDINLPGIETITHLLERTEILQEELKQMRNRLRAYEAL